jgi:hypothetical protein
MLIDCSATWRRELEGDEWVELPDYVVFCGGIWKYAHTENDIRYYRATGFNTYILNSDEGMTFEVQPNGVPAALFKRDLNPGTEQIQHGVMLTLAITWAESYYEGGWLRMSKKQREGAIELAREAMRTGEPIDA